MKEEGPTLVLVVDRDDDVGEKAGLETPIVGVERVVEAGKALLMADPEEADGNAIFGGVKVYNELSKNEKCEIALVSGDKDSTLKADTRIRRELAELKGQLNYKEVVLVSDGVEDEAIVPIILGYAPVRSIVRVVVKHSMNIEESYIVLGKYLKMAIFDSRYSKYFLGVPGLILLVYAFLYMTPFSSVAGYLIALIIGLAFIVRGFNLDNAVSQMRRSPYFTVKFLSVISSLLIVLIGAIKTVEVIFTSPQFQQLSVARLQSIGGIAGISIMTIEPYLWVAIGLQLVVNMAIAARRSRAVLLRELSLLLSLALFYIPFYYVGFLMINPELSAVPLITIILGVLAIAIIVIYYIIFDYLRSRNEPG